MATKPLKTDMNEWENPKKRQPTRAAQSGTWNPSWLRPSVLLAFIVLFLLFAIALGIISHIVSQQNGLSLSFTKNHYSWTYGPTVILVCVVGLWRRVNYCSMINQPWHELSGSSPQGAAQTVLLDYLWPLQLTSFTTSLKNKHFAVSASILVFALLKVIIVISTTLFLPGESIFSQQAQLSLSQKFNSTLFWNSTLPEIFKSDDQGRGYDAFSLGRRPGTSYTTYNNVSADPVWAYFNLLKEYSDSAAPIELSTAFTGFSLQSEIPGRRVQVSADIDVFQPNTTCEIAEIEWPQDHVAKTVNLTMRTPSCNIGRVELPTCPLQDDGLNCPEKAQYFLVERVNCTGDGISNTVWLDETTANTYQYAMFAIDIDSSTRLRDIKVGQSYYQARATRAVAVSCSLAYSIRPGIAKALTLDTTHIDTLDIKAAEQVEDGGIFNFTSLQLSEAIISSLQTAEDIFNYSELARNSMGGHALLGLIADPTTFNSSVTDFERLFDPENLRRKTQETFDGLSHQLIRRYFLLPDHNQTTVSGSVQYGEMRLQIRPLALWTMMGLFVSVACLVAVVMLYTKQGVAPRFPTTLITNASMLAGSPDMRKLLHGLGGERTSQIRKRLAGHSFAAVPCDNGAFRIEALETLRPHEERIPPKPRGFLWNRIKPGRSKNASSKPKREWMPYPARKHAIALILCLPLICITILEILWQFSAKDANFVTLPSDSSAAAYAIRYSSTAFVLGIATLFNSLDFTIATVTPFSALSQGVTGASGERTMFFSMVADLPPVAIYKAVRSRHAGALLSLLASAIGSLLTIVVSSLWFFDPFVQISQVASAKAQSGWRIDFGAVNSTANSTMSSGAALFNEMQHGGTDGGSLIWENSVVLPDINILEPIGSSLSSASEGSGWNGPNRHYYNFTIPAIQPIIECSIIPESLIEAYVSEEEGAGGVGRSLRISNFVATAHLPEGCRSVSKPDETSTITIRHGLDASREGTAADPNWIGFLEDLQIQPASHLSSNGSSKGCPSLGVTFGRYLVQTSAGDNGEDILDYEAIVMLCTQRLRVVEANVAYYDTSPGANSLTPNLTSPIHLNTDNYQPRNLADAQSNISSLSYAMAAHFNNNTTPFLSRPRQRFDNFFEHLTTGPEGISHEDLLDKENLVKAVKALYQKFMVRIIDTDYRVSLNETAADRNGRTQETMQPVDVVVQGTSIQTVSRLKMSGTSKIILEVLLGFMVICGGLAYRLVRIRGVLPRNPYPIASSMALFERSRLLDGLKEKDISHAVENEQHDVREAGSEKSSRETVEKLKDRSFRLGWWDYGRASGKRDVAGSRDQEALMPTQRFGIGLVQEDD